MRIAALALVVAATSLHAQVRDFGVCKSAEHRTTEIGCWILTDQAVGTLTSGEAYWHLDSFDTRAGAERAKGEHGVVILGLGKTWLMTIADKSWKPPAGAHHVADIGPLRITPNKQYSAVFMEAVFRPGMTSAVHRHSGPEAWYTTSGETCLETPDGKIVSRRGQPAIVPAGPPMFLTATGKQIRRAITLILHDASQPPTTMEHTWKPKGLCK